MIVDPMGREIASTKLFERTNITAPLYTTSRIAPIRKYYIYPILIVGLAIILFVKATLQRAKGDPGHHSGSRRQRVKR
jgi:apolipoprotein N-acyltransferase